jgi:hypothetical protein
MLFPKIVALRRGPLSNYNLYPALCPINQPEETLGEIRHEEHNIFTVSLIQSSMLLPLQATESKGVTPKISQGEGGWVRGRYGTVDLL